MSTYRLNEAAALAQLTPEQLQRFWPTHLGCDQNDYGLLTILKARALRIYFETIGINPDNVDDSELPEIRARVNHPTGGRVGAYWSILTCTPLVRLDLTVTEGDEPLLDALNRYEPYLKDTRETAA